MQNQFEQILSNLSNFLNTPLEPDENNICQIKFNNNVVTQLGTRQDNKDLVISSILGEIQETPYRNSIFEIALQVNGASQINISGYVGYGEVSQQLYLFDLLRMDFIQEDFLGTYLTNFSSHALIWISSLENNTLPSLNDFGLYHI